MWVTKNSMLGTKQQKREREGDGTEEDRLLLRNLTVWDPRSSTSCVALGKFLYFSESQLPQLFNGTTSSLEERKWNHD